MHICEKLMYVWQCESCCWKDRINSVASAPTIPFSETKTPHISFFFLKNWHWPLRNYVLYMQDFNNFMTIFFKSPPYLFSYISVIRIHDLYVVSFCIYGIYYIYMIMRIAYWWRKYMFCVVQLLNYISSVIYLEAVNHKQ